LTSRDYNRLLPRRSSPPIVPSFFSFALRQRLLSAYGGDRGKLRTPYSFDLSLPPTAVSAPGLFALFVLARIARRETRNRPFYTELRSPPTSRLILIPGPLFGRFFFWRLLLAPLERLSTTSMVLSVLDLNTFCVSFSWVSRPLPDIQSGF